MVPLAAPLLVRSAGVAVEHPGSALPFGGELDGFGVTEFTAVVGQQEHENLLKVLRTQAFIEGLKDVNNRFGIVSVPKEGQHHFALDKVHGQQHFADLLSFNRVKLHDGRVRMFFHVLLEILKCTTDPAAFVHLERAFFLSGLEPDLARKVNAAGIKVLSSIMRKFVNRLWG